MRSGGGAMQLVMDNRAIEARDGETVLQAALRNGIDVPHFCYHPQLSVSGNCRLCLVRVEGVPKLMPACNLRVTAGMKVQTALPEVARARQAVLQFLMLNHPVDCGICDKAGECRLQDYQYRYGLPRSRSTDPKRHKRKLYDLTPRIQLDNERCILCSRCVRFTREVSRSNLLGIVERGGHAFVERLGPDGAEDAYSDNVIGICPTGALLSRDFLYQSRVWYLEPVRSVCTGCARGCSVDLWRRKPEWRLRALGDERNRMIYRVTARENPDVNGAWICNKGYDLHRSMARPRVLAPALAGAPATVDEAIAEARRLLMQAKSPAALVSAHGSNEELDAFQAALGGRVKVYTREDCRPEPGEVVEDAILIKADKNPNSYGVRRHFGSSPCAAAGGGDHDLFLIWGEWQDYGALGAARVIHLAAFASRHDRPAEVEIPISTHFERSGSFCNFAGTVSRFDEALEKPARVQHAGDVFEKLRP